MYSILTQNDWSEKLKDKFSVLSKKPEKLYFYGNLSLLELPLVAIVGTRKPNVYTKHYTMQIAKALSQVGAVVISGGALGVDMLAHKGAGNKTVMVSPAGIDQYYPKSNAKEIDKIAHHALLISEYAKGFKPYRFSFLERNRLVIALSEYVIIPQADLNSGSMQSARLAQQFKKKLFVFSHRIGESLGTQSLLQERKARVITDIANFIEEFCNTFKLHASILDEIADDFFAFCQTSPLECEVIERFGLERFMHEQLNGKIVIANGRVLVR